MIYYLAARRAETQKLKLQREASELYAAGKTAPAELIEDIQNATEAHYEADMRSINLVGLDAIISGVPIALGILLASYLL